MNAADADQQGVTGAGACPSLRALGENAHSPLTPTPSAVPGTRTRGVAISRPHVLRAHLRGICLTLGPLRRSGGFSLSAVQVIDNLRHMLATPNSPTGTRPGLPFYGRDGLPIQFSVQLGSFNPVRYRGHAPRTDYLALSFNKRRANQPGPFSGIALQVDGT